MNRREFLLVVPSSLLAATQVLGSDEKDPPRSVREGTRTTTEWWNIPGAYGVVRRMNVDQACTAAGRPCLIERPRLKHHRLDGVVCIAAETLCERTVVEKAFDTYDNDGDRTVWVRPLRDEHGDVIWAH